MTMKKIGFSAKMLSMLLLCAFVFACRAEAAEKGYVFLVPVVEGFSYGSFDKLLKDAAAAVSTKTGILVKMNDMKFKSGEVIPPKVIEALKSGKGDFSYIYSQDYLKKPEIRNVVEPLFTLMLNNRKSTDVCAYVRKADGIKSVQQLKGKKWGMSSLIGTFWLLNQEGVKEEPAKFFSSMAYITDTPPTNILDALLSGKIDVFMVSNALMDMSIGNDPKYKAVQRLKCAEFDHNMLFVARKGLPADDVERIKAAFLGAHKDKHFQSFWFLFRAIKGHFEAFSMKDLSGTQRIVDAGLKGGWYDKENAFVKKSKK